MTDNIDTPEQVRAVLAQLGGPNAEFYTGEAESMLERYANLLERSAAKDARIAEYEGTIFRFNALLFVATKRIAELTKALALSCTDCECIHHEKKHQHKSGEPCPVEKIIQEALR